MNKWGYIILAAVYVVGYSSGYILREDRSEPHVDYGAVAIESVVLPQGRERVKCEFDTPLKYVTFINHWYDDWDELNIDYLLYAKPNDKDEVWGWSNCTWQPEDNWAACDIYVVLPEYVRADVSMEILGHEGLHAACGDYHK